MAARGALLLAVVLAGASWGRAASGVEALEEAFRSPPHSARPWVLWHWVNAAVSREGITADLEAMKAAGVGGAYLMTIKGPTDPPLVDPPVVQLTPTWWEMIRHAASEADRLGIDLAMHVGDGFAVAGGPWITPELSMQQLVWSTTHVTGGREVDVQLAQPTTREGYYRDVAVLAVRLPAGRPLTSHAAGAAITTNAKVREVPNLADPNNTERLRSDEPCWIQYAFDAPFTCRSLTIRPDGTNYQCQRLKVEASDDGQTFRPVCQLDAPRHGWQEEGRAVTHAVPETTARFFRFVYDPAGSEPGAEDLDTAKWRPALKVEGIELSSAPRLHHYRGKSGAVWRISPRTTDEQTPPALCTPQEEVIDVSASMSDDGRLAWRAPPGEWALLRFGHTSTGKRNATGGGGRGLECDKFSAQAVRGQFDRWFGEARRRIDEDLAQRVLRGLFVDSWECGSQNWSASFREEFTARRGYDPLPYLPAMAGYPVASADESERFLYDVRRTIAELVPEAFYETLHDLAQEFGCVLAGECTAPTMTGDGMRHFGEMDAPMGEFWLRSPTHDKPNDMRDAISGAHVYGKRVVQAEAFTQLRVAWDEHPAMLKTLGDRNLCLGANRLVYHVFAHNPFLDRRPGVTLGGVGLYFQRDQVWWEAGRAWVEYAARCQSVLQLGRPAADVAVFTGDGVPSRAVLPERLLDTLPGLFGAEAVQRERRRRANAGLPLRELPRGVTASANITDPADWVDPLRGYQYDSINRDALVRLARVEDGKIVLPGGARYELLVVPGNRPMAPHPELLTREVAEKLRELGEDGARVLMVERPTASPSLSDAPRVDGRVRAAADALWREGGVAHRGPWTDDSLEPMGVERDFVAREASGEHAERVAWTHRAGDGWDAYMVANQANEPRELSVSLRAARRHVRLWDPVTGATRGARGWGVDRGRAEGPLRLPPYGSMFVVASDSVGRPWYGNAAGPPRRPRVAEVDGPWRVTFHPIVGPATGPLEWDTLDALDEHADPAVRHFAGQVVYETKLNVGLRAEDVSHWIDLGKVGPIAEVRLNGHPCGVAWTAPWRVDVSDAVLPGENRLEIIVSTTWRNRLIGDQQLPEEDRSTWTTGDPPPADASLQPFGLLGPVRLETYSLLGGDPVP